MNLKTKYRIVTNMYSGFEIQYKVWFFPFWLELNSGITYSDIKKAEGLIKYKKELAAFKPKVVKEL